MKSVLQIIYATLDLMTDDMLDQSAAAILEIQWANKDPEYLKMVERIILDKNKPVPVDTEDNS